MQPLTEEEIKKLIEESKAAGKDVSKLESALREKKVMAIKIPFGERKEKEIDTAAGKGKRVIESTGPAREEDFK